MSGSVNQSSAGREQSSASSAVIDRIVEKNNALWRLLTDSDITRDEALALIDKAFPPRDGGPDYEDGPEFEGWEERSGGRG